MNKLKLEAENGTIRIGSRDDVQPVKFYQSSVPNALTDKPLLTIVSGGRGIRATIQQVEELHSWLGEWLQEVQEDDPV